MITKLSKGTKFQVNGCDYIYMIDAINKKSLYLTKFIVLKNGRYIESNQYNIKSITSKYITIYDVIFNTINTNKLSISEITILKK